MKQKILLIRGERGKIKYRVKVSDYLHNALKNVTLTFYEDGMFVRGAFFYRDGWASTPQKIERSIRVALYKLADYVIRHGGALERATQAAKGVSDAA